MLLALVKKSNYVSDFVSNLFWL